MTGRVLSLLCLGLSGAFGYLCYVQYFRWRHCFNELGRCFDAESGVVYREQSGLAWLSLALLSLGAALYLFWRARTPGR
ncbi:hypothetical protein [Roseovarius sp.]|uniref:hypothetical protein n=1 Tax=Roseovarius sp. TaxID=1486281 RepID=UPI003BAD431D